CGVRTSRRQPRNHLAKLPAITSFNHSTHLAFDRNPKIMHGTPTAEGQYPWQVSLELLHPSYGFIGHWCGGVLIDRNWVLSAAHCIHNDLFNLPLPALWTVVLGEYDRRSESGFEQRIPVDKIILHDKYHNFKHDLVLLKLARPANTSPNSKVRKICLPFADFKVNSMIFDPRPEQQSKPTANSKPAYFFDNDQTDELDNQSSVQNDHLYDDSDVFPESVPFRDENFLRSFKKSLEDASRGDRSLKSRTARYMINHLVAGRLLSLRANQTHPSVPDVSKSSDGFDGRSNRRLGRSSRRLFNVPMFKTDKSHPRQGIDGKRWIYHPFAESAATNKLVSHQQQHRANLNSKFGNNRRRNDKFSHAPVYYRKEPNYRTEDAMQPVSSDANGPSTNFESTAEPDLASSKGAMPDTSQYVDCLATGWGKSTIDDELTDVLLQTRAPIQSSKKCEEAYGEFIKLHRGHLCAGNLDGTGGTCVGDSGGPLQCRISKRGPWILVGITSFGSGSFLSGYGIMLTVEYRMDFRGSYSNVATSLEHNNTNAAVASNEAPNRASTHTNPVCRSCVVMFRIGAIPSGFRAAATAKAANVDMRYAALETPSSAMFGIIIRSSLGSPTERSGTKTCLRTGTKLSVPFGLKVELRCSKNSW
uniref:Peptidase S1 domain-containing protein n=1 Tax=Anopheles dirus TaxID=7168 RepID=A0A182NE19_9DIPT